MNRERVPHDLRHFEERDPFQMIPSEIAGSILAWGAVVILILRDLIR